MAACDYYLCDVCSEKTFYDAHLDYDFGEGPNRNPVTKHQWPSGDVGYMVVLCKDCAATHSVTIATKPPNAHANRAASAEPVQRVVSSAQNGGKE